MDSRLKLVDLRFQALAKPLAKEMVTYYGRPKELAIEGGRSQKRKDDAIAKTLKNI